MRRRTAGGCFALVLATGGSAQQIDVLDWGVTLRGSIARDDATVTAPELSGYQNPSAQAKRYRLRVATDGPFHVDLVSFDFDAYLILRDADGRVLAEDDDGLLGTHARVSWPGRAGAEFLLDAAALHGALGAYELTARTGVPEPLEATERTGAEIADQRRVVEARRMRFGELSAEFLQALDRLGYRMWSAQRFADALPVMQRALEISKNVHGPDSARTGLAHLQVGAQLRGLGRFADAEGAFECAVAVLTAAGGPFAQLEGALLSLRAVQMAGDRVEAGAETTIRLFEARARALGPDHEQTAKAVNQAFSLLSRARPSDRQLELCALLADRCEVHFGPDAPLSLRASICRAESLARARRIAGALPFAKRALSAWEEDPQAAEPSRLLEARCIVGSILSALGRLDEAEPVLRRALAEDDGGVPVLTASAVNELALIFAHTGRAVEAETLVQRGLALMERVRPDTLRLEGLKIQLRATRAAALAEQGRTAEAAELQREVVAASRALLEPEDPDLAVRWNNLGEMESALDRHAAAEAAHREALAIYATREGPPYTETIEQLGKVANALAWQDRWSDAAAMRVRAVQLSESAHGAAHQRTASLRLDLAHALHGAEQYAAAEATLRRAQADLRSAGDEIGVRDAQRQLARVLASTERFAEARELLRGWLAATPTSGADESEWRLRATIRLAYCEAKLGRIESAKATYRAAEELLNRDPDRAGELELLAEKAAFLVETGRFCDCEALIRDLLARDPDALDGGDEPTLALLHALAQSVRRQGRDAESDVLYGTIATRIPDGVALTHVQTYALFGLASSLQERGRDAAAIEQLERVLAGVESPTTAEQRRRRVIGLRELAEVRLDLGERERALELVREALALAAIGTSLDDERQRASTLHALGRCLAASFRLPEAETALRNALAIREVRLGVDSDYVAQTLGTLGDTLMLSGRVEEGVDCLERALSIREANHTAEHHDVVSARIRYGRALARTGRALEAEQVLLPAIEIAERGWAEYPARWEDELGSSVVACLALDRYFDAERLIRRCLEVAVARLGPDHPELHSHLVNLGQALDGQGRLSEAEVLYRRALDMLKEAGLEGRADIALNSLALVRRGRGDLDGAIDFIERSTGILAETGRRGSLDWFAARGNLALFLTEAGREPEAQRVAEELLVDTEGRTEFARARVQALQILAWIHATRRSPDAEIRLQRALAAMDPLAFAKFRVETLGFYGAFCAAEGRRDEARERFDAAWESQLEIAASALRKAPSSDRFRALVDVRRFVRLAMGQVDLGDAAQCARLFTRLSAHKALVHRTGIAVRGELSTADDDQLRPLVAELRARVAELSNLAFRPAVGDAAQHSQALWMAEMWRRRAELELFRRLELPVKVRVAEPTELSVALPRAAAAVDFHVLSASEVRSQDQYLEVESRPEHVFAFIVRSGESMVRAIDLGEADVLRNAVDAYLGEMESADPAATGRLLGRGRRLRGIVWDPLLAAVGEATTIFVTPDSFLARLPFETLPLEGDRFLLEERRFVYGTDPVSLLDELRREPEAAERGEVGSVLLAGGVDYGDTAGARRPAIATDARGEGFSWRWEALPETLAECEDVLALCGESRGRVTFLHGADAVEDRVQAAMAEASIVHIATHGFFEPAGVPSLWQAAQAELRDDALAPQRIAEVRQMLTGHPPGLLSGLVLAGANDPPPEGDDGYLTAEEVAYVDLTACRLVVLSGCETGVGTVRGGEGMLSLRRAFHEAGARTVVATHWRVRDTAARELAVEFYRRLWRDGLAPAIALRGAKLALLERHRAAGRVDPGAWGAYVLSGDWR